MSRRKDALSWALIALVLLLVAAAAVYILWPQMQPHATLRIGDGVFKTKVAKTSAEREKGLTETTELREDQAMLLVYERNDKWDIWMKDIEYPLDIVWLDASKTVVHIVKNAPPESYPYEKFTPKKEARYVLELPGGTVSKKSIKIDDKAVFDENHLEGIKL